MPALSEQKISELRLSAERYAALTPNHHIEALLGAGGSAAVFRLNTPQGYRALKIYDAALLAPENKASELHRLDIQKRLINKHCDALIDTYKTYIDETIFIEMEYCEWPQLKEVVSAIPSNQIQPLIYQLVQGVRFLESLGLVHRDIKPENILINPDFTSLKIIDFGVIRDSSSYDENINLTDHGIRKPFLATAQYSSPEYLFRLIEPGETLWKGLSIYQVGSVLHDLLTKQPIFQEEVQTQNRYIVAMAVLRKRPSFDEVTDESLQRLKRIASNCLVKDIQTRLALVDWKDFENTDESQVEKLKRLLTQKRALAAIQRNSSQKELSINRAQCLQILLESVRLHLVKELGDFVKFAFLTQPNDEQKFEVQACMTNGDQILQAAIQLDWGTEDQEEIAKISLNTNSHDSEDEHIIGTIHITGSGNQELTIGIVEKFSALISAALSL